MLKTRSMIASAILPAASLACGVIVWEIGVRIGNVPAWILPSPTRVFFEAIRSVSLLMVHTLTTLVEAVAGLVVAAAFGFAVAISCEWSQKVKKMLYPLLVVSQTLPTIVLAPLFALWFGFGYASKIGVITLVCFFPIAMGLLQGFDSVEESFLKVFKTMGASRSQILRMIKLPFALPGFFGGLRIAATYSVLGAVIAEWFGAERGLGILLVRSAKSYLTDRVFATVFVITVMTLLIVGVIEFIRHQMLSWKKY